MDNTQFKSYVIEDRSYIAFVKREIHHLLTNANFSKTKVAEIDIIVSEITSNIHKHVGNGELLYRVILEDKRPVFEILSIDNGPGIKDVQLAKSDGVSSSSTLGHGLGAIGRLSNQCEIYSIPNWGTILYAKVENKAAKGIAKSAKAPTLSFKGLKVAKPGEEYCGDEFCIKKINPQLTQIYIGDGLGHGLAAFQAAQEAKNAFINSTQELPSEIVNEMHQQVKDTRGLVGAVSTINTRLNEWKICSIGNIAVKFLDGQACKSHANINGIIGSHMPTKITDSKIDIQTYNGVVMCSDGIKTRWNMAAYPYILKYDAIIQAAAIYKDFARKTDDMTILVGRL